LRVRPEQAEGRFLTRAQEPANGLLSILSPASGMPMSTDSDSEVPAILEPKSQAEILRDLWHDVKDIKHETKRTNGRVSRIERVLMVAAAAAAGALFTAGVINFPFLLSLLV
jgi:hypothetical protein